MTELSTDLCDLERAPEMGVCGGRLAIPDFEEYPKTPRLHKPIIVTEKIDGTNAQVCITEDGRIFAGSRSRWITPKDDNYGFARWVEGHKTELLKLGPGRHFGEWWGAGIQRGYGMKEKVFSLFNVGRWTGEDLVTPVPDFPNCCRLVPVITVGEFGDGIISLARTMLQGRGSFAAHGFMRPEGLIVFHTAARSVFKILFEGDNKPKSQMAA